MCSLVGYVGKNLGGKFVLEGLKQLEYRGYDSAGFACIAADTETLVYDKVIGGVQELHAALLLNPLNGYKAIGHTRWSTHGVSTVLNAHPQLDCGRTIAVVHNGIIENGSELRKNLEAAGHRFISDTDTEVVAHLLEQSLSTGVALHEAVSVVVQQLRGSFALLCLTEQYPNQLILVRKSSPLCIGFGDGELFVASDSVAFAGPVSEICFLPDKSFALVDTDGVSLYDFMGTEIAVHKELFVCDIDRAEDHPFEHVMLKEIYEQKKVIERTLEYTMSLGNAFWNALGMTRQEISQISTIHMVGCGTSYHAARIGQFFFETVAEIPVHVHSASEFRHRSLFAVPTDIFLFLSQSGETADTLEALRMVKVAGIPTIVLTNSPTSTMVREADGFLLTKAGVEVAVASTKTFSTQLVALYWLAHCIALEKKRIDASVLRSAHDDLMHAAAVLQTAVEKYQNPIGELLAKKYAHYTRALFLGRHSSYPFAMEAALKLKEISYIFAEAYPAGELKHGPLALVDEHTPVFIFSHLDSLVYQKLLTNAYEVKARRGRICAFVFEGQDELAALADDTLHIPCVNPLLGPLAMTGVMQLFVYAIAKELGRPIDKPRNLAKSVTVE